MMPTATNAILIFPFNQVFWLYGLLEKALASIAPQRQAPTPRSKAT